MPLLPNETGWERGFWLMIVGLVRVVREVRRPGGSLGKNRAVGGRLEGEPQPIGSVAGDRAGHDRAALNQKFRWP
jgi:hypothetical protein